MEKFNINGLLEVIISNDSDLREDRKLELLEKVNYEAVTSIQAVKIIEGIINYGTLISKKGIEELPKVDCKKLNTAIYLMIKYYKTMNKEEIREDIGFILNINVDEKTGGYVEKDKNAPQSAVSDILEDYVFGSSPYQTSTLDLNDNEISLYELKADYGDNTQIRESRREIFD